MRGIFRRPVRDAENIRETQSYNTKQKSSWSYWRHLCCLSDKYTQEVPTRNVELMENQERGSDLTRGWQGPSSKTLRDLLQKVVKLDMNDYQGVDDLHIDIYDLYVLDKQQQGFSKPIKDEDYQKDLLATPCPEGISSQTQESNAGEWGGYHHFLKESTHGEAKNERRFSLNIQPDHISIVTKDIVKKIAELDYVSCVKVAYTVETAFQSLDNIVIYFHDSAKNKNKQELEQLLLDSYVERYTRPGNPATMETIGKGIAFADQSKGGGFGDTRVQPIVEAVVEVLTDGKELTFETLLPKVKEHLKVHKIDPENPHLNLP